MGHQQRGALRGQRPQRLVDGRLGGGVDRRGGVVEHQHPRVGEHRARQRDALALAARERQPPLPDQRVVAVGQDVDERVHLRGPGRGPALLVARVRAAVGDVGPDGVGEQERLLEHHPQLAAQVVQPQLRQRHATQAQLAALRVVEPRQQQRDGGLARPRGAHQRERLPRLDPQRHPVEHRFAAGVAERHAVQLDGERPGGQRGRRHRVDDVGLGIDHVVHPLDAGPGQLRGDDHRAEQPRGPDQPGDVGGEGQERAQGDGAAQREVAAQPDDADLPQGRQRQQGGVEPGRHARRPHPLRVEPAGAALQRGDLARLLPEALDHPDPGDGLLDLLGDVGGPLLRRPGGREQRRPGLERDPAGDGQQHQRHEREQRREPQHRPDGHDDEHDRAQRQRHDRQQALQQLQVGDRPRDHLAGAQRVLPLAVEPLHGREDLAAQVVLHVQGEPPAQVPPQERGGEPEQREAQQHRDDQPEDRGDAPHGVVDGHPDQQRPDGVQAHPQRRRHEGRDRDGAVAHRRADQPPDPTDGGGGGGDGHSDTVCRPTDNHRWRRPVPDGSVRWLR